MTKGKQILKFQTDPKKKKFKHPIYIFCTPKLYPKLLFISRTS